MKPLRTDTHKKKRLNWYLEYGDLKLLTGTVYMWKGKIFWAGCRLVHACTNHNKLAYPMRYRVLQVGCQFVNAK